MHALLRYPKWDRRAMAQLWGNRSQAVQASNRIGRGVDFESKRFRALHDARGKILCEGVTYRQSGEVKWQVVRSMRGKTNQVDLIVNGLVVKTCGVRALCRWAKLSNNTTGK